MTWTDERTAALANMRQQGLSVGTMARKLGLSRGSIAGKLSRLEGRSGNDRRFKGRETYHLRGDWDNKTFEPYTAFKARKQAERANAVR